jgi:WD40 repeat protein
MNTQIPYKNPYVGPRPFQKTDPLFGRDREIRQLLNLLIAKRIILLHSPSGAGKSSLVQAGVMPELEKEGFYVLPSIRVNMDLPEELRGSPAANRYLFSTLKSLNQELALGQFDSDTALSSCSLKTYLDELVGDGNTVDSSNKNAHARQGDEEDSQKSLVLFFDQFEEILTVDPLDREGKLAFFDQLGQAMLNRRCWFLFAMREDYVGALEPYLRPIPTYLGNRFRLDLLEKDAACQAILNPTKGAGVEFTDLAVNALVKDLCRVKEQLFDGSTREQTGLYVEPVQLQVVCYRLWDQIAAQGKAKITEQDLVESGSVDTSLAQYYGKKVGEIAKASGISERNIREWFDEHLITENKLRGQVLLGDERKQGLNNQVIYELENAHLVRGEKRGNTIWIELSHDRLVDPVRENNKIWFQENLSTLQRQARIWDKDRDNDNLLLRGKSLKEARIWERINRAEMDPPEKEFYRRSLDVQRKYLRNIVIVIAVVIFLGAATVFSIINAQEAQNQKEVAQKSAIDARESAQEAHYQQIAAQASLQKAQLSERVSIVRGVASEAQLLSTDIYDRAVLLAYEASRIDLGKDPENQKYRIQALTAASQIYEEDPSVYLRGNSAGWINSVKFTPDRRQLYTGSMDGQIQAWDYKNFDVPIKKGDPMIAPGGGAVQALAINPSGELLAAAYDSNRVILWNAKTRAYVTLLKNDRTLDSTGQWLSVDFSLDGSLLAAGHSSGRICIWNLSELSTACRYIGSATGQVRGLKFNPNTPHIIYSGDTSGALTKWDLTTNKHSLIGKKLDQGILSLDISPDGQQIATGGDDMNVRLWNLSAPLNESLILGEYDQWVIDVAYSPSGHILASASGDGSVSLWDMQTRQLIGQPFKGFTGYMLSLAFSPADEFNPDGLYLAGGQTEGNVRLWPVKPYESYVWTNLPKNSFHFNATAISPDGRWFATVNEYNQLDLFDLITRQPTYNLLTIPGTVNQAFFNPTGKILLTVSYLDQEKYELHLYDIQNPVKLGNPPEASPHGDGKAVSFSGIPGRIVFSPDGKIAAVDDLSSKAQLMIWDLTNNSTKRMPVKGYIEYSAMAINEDNSLLAISQGFSIILYNLANGKPSCQLDGHINTIRDMAFVSKRNLLLSISDDGTIRSWNPKSCKVVDDPFTQLRTSIYSLKINPSGDSVAVVDKSGNIIVWDLNYKVITAQYKAVVKANPQVQISFSEDQRYLFSYHVNSTEQDENRQQLLYRWPVEFATKGDFQQLAMNICMKVGRNLTEDEWKKYFPNLDYHESCPDLKIVKILTEADQAAQKGDYALARMKFDNILKLSTEDWIFENEICVLGALDHAVTPALLKICDDMVAKADVAYKGPVSDSRGIARAIFGDTQGAIQDFQAYIDWAKIWTNNEKKIEKRENWILALKNGQNPFDDITLEDHRYEE